MNTMSIEYDCGMVIEIPLVLESHQTLLHHSALADQMIMMADSQHDSICKCGQTDHI